MNRKRILPLTIAIMFGTACSKPGRDQEYTETVSAPEKQPDESPTEVNEANNSEDVVQVDKSSTTKVDDSHVEQAPLEQHDVPFAAVNPDNGAIDSSGGNLTNSTESQVRLFLQDPFLRKFLSTAVKRLKLIRFKDEHSTLLAPLLLGNDVVNQPIEEFIRKMNFDRIEESNCLDSHTGEARDASVDAIGRYCFDIARMQRIPFESLQLEIVALVLHEIAHEYGYSETDAVRIQNLIRSERSRIWPDQRTIESVESDLAQIRWSLIEVESDLLSRAFAHAHVCSGLGNANGASRSWYTLFGHTSGSIIFRDAYYVVERPTYLPRSNELVDLATELHHLNRNFCLFVPDQSEEEFLKNLAVVREKATDLLETVSMFVRP